MRDALLHDIVQPDAFLYENDADDSLYAVGELHEEVDPQDRQRRAFSQSEGKHHADAPDKNAVEKERDQCFAAGAEREIQSV